ncbi:hypothetical protein JKP88DRAFT_234774 [Tribonema minus]|uniref:Uncharacterized protein n=1 Tax=Tribonema minus TaxID=303371 RepID=A0A835ZD29_9STRA|nr:hypothetical protein JKP88DRAFT_234774 [Tribonema minus]
MGYRRAMKQEAAFAQEAAQRGLGRAAAAAAADLPFSPTHHAARALCYGTALACAGCGLGVVAIGVGLGVSNVQEFAAVMRQWTPNALRRLGWQPPAAQQAEARVLEGMTFEEELAYWSKVTAAEEASGQRSSRAGVK